MQVDAIRRISIQATTTGFLEAIDSQKKLADAQGNVAIAAEKQERATLSVEQAQLRLNRSMQLTNQSSQQMEKANNSLSTSYRAANDNIRDAGNSALSAGIEFATTANHLKLAALAAYAWSPAFRAMVNPAIVSTLKLIGPAAVTAGATVASALSGPLAFLSRLAIPIFIAVGAWKAMNAITELGAQKLKEFQDIADKANSAGVSTDFFQRMSKGAEDLKLKTDKAAEALKKFSEISAPKLGGNEFDKQLAELTKAGNFAKNFDLTVFKMTTGTEEKYRALLHFLSTAVQQGDRLAALDLAEKFMPDEMMKKARATFDIFGELLTKMNSVKQVDIISAQQIAYAVQLNKRLEDAEKIIADKLKPLQKDLTQLGMNFQESWVKIVELEASAVTWGNALYDVLKKIPGILQDAGGSSFWTKYNEFIKSRGLDFKLPGSIDIPTGKSDRLPVVGGEWPVADIEARTAAIKKLAAGMRELYGDTSKVAPPVEAASKEFDRLEKSLERTAAAQLADAASVGASVGERLALRTAFKLLEAAEHDGIQVMKDGVIVNQEYADRIKKVSITLGAAAQIEAQRTAQNKASFDLQTVFLSDLDRQIATVQKSIHGDRWKEFMNDGLAATMRVTAALKSVTDALSGAGAGFIKDIASGVDKMKALDNAAKKFGETLIDIGSKGLVEQLVGGLASAFGAGGSGTMTVGATSASSILIAAGTSVQASMVAGATQAATILGLAVPAAASALPVAAGVAAVELNIGATLAGLTLKLAAGVAAVIMNPMNWLMAAVALVGSLFLSSSSGDDAATRAAQLARQRRRDYRQERDARQDFHLEAMGLSGGGLTEQLSDAQDKWRDLKKTAKLAGKPTADIDADFALLKERLKDEFKNGFGGLIDALKSGLGENSPAVQAQRNVLDLGKALKELIVDAALIGRAPEARQAAQKYALSLLSEQEPLTRVQERMLTLQGTAQGLERVLQELGMSSGEAAAQIRDKLNTEIGKLRDEFKQGLQEKIFAANDKGYINDITALLKERQSLLKDAGILGAGGDMVGKYFSAQAKQIIEGADLSGHALQELSERFPMLTGVINNQIAVLRQDFRGELQAGIFDAKGKGYINQVNDLLGQLDDNLKKADALGVDRGLVQNSFEAQLKSVVAQAGLTGAALQELSERFPMLTGVIKNQIAVLRQDFRGELQAGIFDAKGKGYINQVNDLLGQLDDNLKKADVLGVDRGLVQNSFEAQLQSIVDHAGLVGNAFDEFTKRFPDLAKRVHESTEALEQQVDAQKQLRKQIKDYLLDLHIGPQSTLAPRERLTEARDSYEKQFELARAGNQEALSGITGFADTLLEAARAVWASSPAFQEIFEQVQRNLSNLPIMQGKTESEALLDAMQESDAALLAGLEGIGSKFGTESERLLDAMQESDATLLAWLEDIGSKFGTVYDPIVEAIDELQFSEDIAKLLAGIGGQIFEAAAPTLSAAEKTNGLLNVADEQLALANSQLGAANTQLTAASGHLGSANVRLEAVKAQLGALDPMVGQLTLANANLDAARAGLGVIDARLGVTNAALGVIDARLGVTNATLGMQIGTANYYLALMWEILGRATLDLARIQTFGDRFFSNMLDQLREIEKNTRNIGGMSAGGWVTGGMAGRDSVVRSLMPGEFVMPEGPARTNALLLESLRAGGTAPINTTMPTVIRSSGRAPVNDNTDVVNELRRVNVRIESMEKRLVQATVGGAQLVRDEVARTNELQDDTNKRLRRQG